MPFDPTKPANNSPNSSAEMRAQLTGLKDLIDAVPAGPPGENGTSVTGAVIDGTNTLNPGEPAQASVSWDGANVRFTFGIPRGQDGVSSPPITSFIVDGVSTLNPGEPATVQTSFNGASVSFLFGIPRGNDGTNGSNGNDGGPGAQGPPFANAIVDSVTTLNPGDNATVQTIFDGSHVRFQFGIPRGQNGNDGGSGPPGEVTNAQLSSAIAGTSNLSNAVATLDTPFANDPPTLADLELMRAKMNELITALRR
jgi:hypothetical protein